MSFLATCLEADGDAADADEAVVLKAPERPEAVEVVLLVVLQPLLIPKHDHAFVAWLSSIQEVDL